MLSYFNIFKQIINHPANEGKQIESLFRALNWQLTAKSKEVTEIDFFGYKILVHNPEVARRLIYFHNYYDFNTMKFMERYLKPGDFFIDMGANIGIYSLLAASLVGKEGHIDSFEAFPTTFERLKENVERNDINHKFDLHPLATGESSKTINFTTKFDTRNFVVNNESKQALSDNHNLVSVSCVAIDDILSHYNNYAMAKIDVEGYELATLKGAQELLSNHNPPVLLMEMNEAFSRYGYTALEIEMYLNEKGYDRAVYEAQNN
jgi:FkbM family methyltransferase